MTALNNGLKIWRGAALVTLLEALSLLVGFLTQPILMRTLGPADYGSYVLAVSVGVLVFMVTDFGFNVAGVQRAIMLRGDIEAGHRHFWCVFLAKASIGTIALLAVAIGMLALAPPQASDIMLAAALAALSAVMFPTWYALAAKKLLLMAGSLLLARIASLVLVVALVHDGSRRTFAVALSAGVPLLAALLVSGDREFRSMMRWHRISLAEWQQTLRAGAATAWVTAFPSLAGAGVQSLIAGLTSSATLGLYVSADKVRAAIQGLFTAFGHAAFPSSVEQANSGAAARSTTLGLLLLNTSLALLVAVPLGWWSPEVMAQISGPGFEGAAAVLRVLCVAIISSTFVSTLGLQVLVPLGGSAAYARATALGLILQCAALAWLAPRYGALGAGVCMVLGDLCCAALMLPQLSLHRRATRANPGRR